MSATPAAGGGGGTQQSATTHHHCSDCGLMFDSAASLQVHLHYHHDPMMSRASWGPPPSNSGSPTDPDNNNHAPKKVSNVIAAADSSDNQMVNVKQEPGLVPKIEPQQQPQQNSQQQQQQHQQQHVVTSYHTPYDMPPHQQYSPNYGYDVYYGLENPYMNQDFMGKHSAQQMHQQQQQVSSRYQPYQHSPRVSSSSPSGSAPGGVCIPSPSPVQCDKCGMVCDTAAQLQEHALSHSDSFQYPPMPNANTTSTKDSSSEILDLDSHKVVYPAVLPSLQGLQGMQPHWQDTQPPQSHQLYHQAAFPPQSASQDIKLFRTPSEHAMQPGMQQASHPPHMVSPPDFPTTTTPQQHDNGVGGFRPAGTVPQITSSHPIVAPGAKGPGWKSNEARRPKTYNCTACNKWFTSSGHLKRHYNTTLHKNAVKSSGQPDPANLPISAHHHPGRDPNHPTHHKGGSSPSRRLQSQQQRSPEPQAFPPQSQQPSNPGSYILPHSYGSFTFPGIPPDTGQPPPGGDMHHQQIENNTTSTTNHLSGSPPNGQAGPSVHNLLPLPRGLQIHNSLTVNTTNIMEEQSVRHMPQQPGLVPQDQDLLLGQSARSPIWYRQPRRSPHTITPDITDMAEDLDQQVTSNLQSADQGQSTNTPLFLVIPPGNRITNSHHIIGDTNGSVVALRDPVAAPTPLQHQYNQHMDYDFVDPLQHPPFSPAIPDQEPSTPSPQQLVVTSSEPDKKPVIHRCDACDKQFNKACYLTQHNKSFHCGDKPFKCSRCGKRFKNDALHEEHIAKHAGDKPFKCGECPKQFNHKTDLRRHMCLHSGSKPYACHLCGKGFVRKDHMLKHCDTHRKKSKEPNTAKRPAAVQA